jgi:hypothetical protein
VGARPEPAPLDVRLFGSNFNYEREAMSPALFEEPAGSERPGEEKEKRACIPQ